jgi:LacI family transcriptional regulator
MPGINQHPEEIGHAAVAMLNSLILSRITGVPEVTCETLVHGTWVDGSSLPRKLHPQTSIPSRLSQTPT